MENKTPNHINFGSIEQFRNVIYTVNNKFNFVGLDDNGAAIYDSSLPKPVLNFEWTVKLHGTNAAACYNNIDGFWEQSREQIITTEKDNAGFSSFVNNNLLAFNSLFTHISNLHKVNLFENTISIFGEFVGKGINKGVAIANLPKSFFIFAIKVTPIESEVNNDNERKSYWIHPKDLNVDKTIYPDVRIYNIYDYPHGSITIDFNKPELSQNEIIDLTLKVEEECPVSKAFGFSGIGEGIVLTSQLDNTHLMFKSKGVKHSESKVKFLKPVDDEKINKLIELAEKVTPEWRLEQMLQNSCDLLNGGFIERKKMGDFMKAVIQDVIKEDDDILAEAGVEIKDLGKYISEIAKKYFFAKEKEVVKL